MEFRKNKNRFEGYNDMFMTSSACEGMIIHMYYRHNLNDKFIPLDNKSCDRNCLNVAKGKASCEQVCDYNPFLKAKANKYSIY